MLKSASLHRRLLLAGGCALGGGVGLASYTRDARLATSLCSSEASAARPAVIHPFVSPGDFRNWNDNWDFRGKESSTKGGATSQKKLNGKTRTLILIRHGQYDTSSNADKDPRLTELGREQARLTGRRLQALRDAGLNIDKVHFSTMARATETAELIMESLPGVPSEQSDLLREGVPCESDPHPTWQPRPYKAFRDSARIEAAFRHHFYRGSPLPAPEAKKNGHDGGAGEATENAGTKGVDGRGAKGETSPAAPKPSAEVLVCHGNVIRYCVLRALQLPPQAWLRLSVNNCGISAVKINASGTVSLQSLGDTGHLPAEKITYH